MRFLLAENTALKQFDLIARIASINSVCFSFFALCGQKKSKTATQASAIFRIDQPEIEL